MPLLSNLLSELQLTPSHHCPAITLNHLSCHSDTVGPNGLFLAYKGNHLDGRDFIHQAIERGAMAIFYDQENRASPPPTKHPSVPFIGINRLPEKLTRIAKAFYGALDEQIPLIGITGTNGKSSISHFLAQAFDWLGHPCGLIGTLGNGRLHALHVGPNTTPDAVQLFNTLETFKQDAIRYVVLEASSQGLSEGRLNDVCIDIAVFSNLSHDHLDYHHTMQAYADAKAMLFAKNTLNAAIVNQDDGYSSVMLAACLPGVRQYTYSLHHRSADVYLNSLNRHAEQSTLSIHTPKGNLDTTTALLGDFNLYNLLATVTTLMHVNTPLSSIEKIIPQLQAPPGRMQCLQTKQHGYATVIIDYAHTPQALEAALTAIRSHLTQGKLWCVFGCGGDRDRTKRPKMATVAETYADHIILTQDNPRFEAPEQILSDIIAGFSAHCSPHIENDRALAIEYALSHADKKDVILLAGKGHETYQCINNQKQPFNETAIIAQYIKGQLK